MPRPQKETLCQAQCQGPTIHLKFSSSHPILQVDFENHRMAGGFGRFKQVASRLPREAAVLFGDVIAPANIDEALKGLIRNPTRHNENQRI